MGAGTEHWERVASLEALGTNGTNGASGAPDAVARLLEVLAGDKECWHTKTAALRALARLGATAAGPAILKTLARDPDPDVREAAIEALGALGFQQARRLLERLSDDPHQPALAAAARRALARLEG
ncbi:MAG TPA: HEAT repeat domain-containing protein [Polyangia bacterium]|jgi:HEAT repeat protein|nr:HEAT repeat domain-containing protein [Polyangia bacterium]